MTTKQAAFNAMPGDNAPVEVDVIDGALSTTASIVSPTINVGPVQIQDPSTTDKAKVVDGSTIVSTDIALAVHDANGVKDGGPGWVSTYGVAGEAFVSADQHSAAAAITDAPTAGQKLVITDLILSADATLVVTLTEETTGLVLGTYYMSANSCAAQITPRGKLKLSTANKRLMLQTDKAGDISALVFYFSEA